ncbi:MAG: SdpI family protein [Bacteroidota bacterium]
MDPLTTTFITSAVGLIFLIAGLWQYYYPPKQINTTHGYRTSSSTKSQQRWDFAQQYSGKLMARYGLFLILLAIAMLLIDLDELIHILLSIGLVFGFLILLILKTEQAIKKRFG